MVPKTRFRMVEMVEMGSYESLYTLCFDCQAPAKLCLGSALAAGGF
jgi:hypothetical protein